MLTIKKIVSFYQPEVYARLVQMFHITLAPEEEGLTPEQEYLARLMQQRPRPGRG